MKVCVYTICKNEESHINDWYESVKEADEIYVLDTGSSDKSVEILKNLPKVFISQKIIEPFNFSVARTEAFKLLPSDTDVCVSIDIDETFSNGWRNYLENNQYAKKYPVRSLYFSNFKDNNDLKTKYISHPYYYSLEWKYCIFEEPVVSSDNSYSLWSWVDVFNPVIPNIIVYHHKDSAKNREYSSLIENKIIDGFSTIKQVCSTKQLLHISLSLIEPLDILNPSFYSLKEEIFNILLMRWNKLSNSVTEIEKIYFNYMLMSYSMKIGMETLSFGYAHQLNHLISKITDFTSQAILQDSIYPCLITNNIELFKEIVKKILVRFKYINTLEDNVYFKEFLTRTLGLSSFLDKNTINFLKENLIKSNLATQKFLETGIFNKFTLK